MLFNSYPFLFGFFPVTLLVFFFLGRFNHDVAAGWLALASLFFYGYWSVAALPLLVVSICVNYWYGLRVSPLVGSSRQSRRVSLYAAVALNLGCLAYFKYANFFIDNVNLALHAASAAEVRVLNVVLPIGISFFTFTQIAFLVDCHQGKVRERNFIHYLLFVSYFPHLIAGPVLHHSQMMPQFRDRRTYHLQSNNILTGLFMVSVGLIKKVLLADEFSQYASPIFNAARDGAPLGFIVAWTGALAYTLQIYFDFSGYTDMAIGLSRMLGITLPLNFDSPYKASSIIDFWRRWHITLSQFLRDYLYVPLGGNRKGPARRYINLMLTMLLGGLWHGASWTFVVWGGLHGAYLLVNHAYRTARLRFPPPSRVAATLSRGSGSALTFMAVVVAWVFFRSTTFDGAAGMLHAMVRFAWPVRCAPSCFDKIYGGLAVPPTSLEYLGAFFLAGFVIVWLLPNSQECARRFERAAGSVAGSVASLSSGALLFFVALLALINASHRSSEFIYFNF
jgi:alginate O-acetyltransferase complex protein AlgI